MLRTALILAILVTVASLAFATPLTVNYVSCPTGCTGPAPYYSDKITNQDVDFRYQVQNWSTAAQINSVTVTFQVYDDASDPVGAKGEAGRADLIVTGPNIPLASFGPNLNGITAGHPDTITTTITDPTELAELLTHIDNNNGHFQLQIHSTNGDYMIVGPGTITMDVNLTPEPASFALIGFGLVGLAALRRKRSKR
jgi:hypothetical protein